MTDIDAERARLRSRLAEAGYTPGRRDVAPLVDLVVADAAEPAALRRALARAPAAAVVAAVAARLPAVDDGAGARLLAVVAEAGGGDAAGRALVLASLDDVRPRTQRAAVVAAGKLGGDDARAAVCRLWDRGALTPALARAAADALGKLGGDDARRRLAATVADGDRELARRRDRALLISERDEATAPSTLVLDRAPAGPVVVVAHCRAGLESLLAAELAEAGLRPHRLGHGRVMADLDGPLATLGAARLALHAGIYWPLAAATADDLAAALAAAAPLLAAWTDGPVRWRLAFERGGHRRALVWAAAAATRARAPSLVNQPRETTWDVVVGADERHLELRPRALGAARFGWRVVDIPAASHPTIAAALARVAAPTADATAWDPFVGSGGELCELARLTAGGLHGSDLDPRSLAAADANLTAAGARARATLTEADALAHRPPPVDVIISNPPMGMRLRGDVGALLAAFAARVPACLTPRGRLVWLTPAADRTGPPLAAAGLRRTYARHVDLGGHEVMLERWDR
ncbi:MAG: methyltransferase [Kofleriaceae bacterium]